LRMLRKPGILHQGFQRREGILVIRGRQQRGGLIALCVDRVVGGALCSGERGEHGEDEHGTKGLAHWIRPPHHRSIAHVPSTVSSLQILCVCAREPSTV